MNKGSALRLFVLVIVVLVFVIYLVQRGGQEEEPRDCVMSQECDDDLFCTGAEVCVNYECVDGTRPCNDLTDPCIKCVESEDRCGCDVTDNLDPCCCKPYVCLECNFCEGDFDIDRDVDGDDLELFLADFGRGPFNNPCEEEDPCNGDFCCDGDVDGDDLQVFLADFGRNSYHPTGSCPIMGSRVPWCSY